MSTEGKTSNAAASSGGRRWRRLAGLLVAALGGCAALAGAPSAYAGHWMQVSCVNPNGSSAPSQGWSSFGTGGPGYGSNTDTGCRPGNPMYAMLSTAAAAPVGSGEILQYSPPGGSTLVGGEVYVSMYADGFGYNASGTAVAYTPAFAYDGSDVFFQCAAGLTPCANGTNDYSGPLALPSNRGGSLFLGAGCGGVAGYACNQGGSNGTWALVQVWWAELLLESAAAPSASAVMGALLEPGARGTQDLAFSASDAGGPGVYAVRVQADATTLYDATPDENSGQCAAVGISEGALLFDYSQPCKQSEALDLPIDTAPLHDGQHSLKVSVEDAAQNWAVVYVGTISSDNAPANTSVPAILGAPLAGASLSAQPGQWSAPTGAGQVSYAYQWQECDAQGNACQPIPGAQGASFTPGPGEVGQTLRVLVGASDADGSASALSGASAPVAPALGLGAANGTGASETAQLRLAGRSAIWRPFAKRALRLHGRLLDSAGQAIAGASLDVLAQVAGGGGWRLLGRARTRADGFFVAYVPPGPSRSVQLAYRAFSGDLPYAAQARVVERVGAGVALEVSPRATSSIGTILLRGRVAGPIPAGGVVLELAVRYLGRWQPLLTQRSDSRGRFSAAYRFQGAVGSFPFRAEVFAGQSGFPYGHGDSRPVDVSTS